MKVLVFDTETTGFPSSKKKLHDESQPHMVQLSALLFDTKTEQIIKQINKIIKPNNWDIPDAVIKIHGITEEKAINEGESEESALDLLLDMYNGCDLKAAHNIRFDDLIIKIAISRYKMGTNAGNLWCKKESYCTFRSFKNKIGGSKGHKLSDAYHFFTGEKLLNSHDALADAKACLIIYKGLTQ